MSVTINGTSGLTFNDASTQATAATGFGFKNRIINGDMRIDQRNAGASVTPTSSTYTLDRWFAIISQPSKLSVQQNAGSVTPPAGFTNYLGITSLSSFSVGSGEFFVIAQYIEGFNTADLGWGTANAQPVTISFWVRSSLTGTFGGALRNSATNRSYPFAYTISAANTWEQKSITVTGDTTGTWATNNTAGIQLFLGLGVGSSVSGTAGAWAGTNYLSATGATSVVGTSGATFYITGVQLEKGSTATSFDYRPYGTELALCQRYFQYAIDARQNVSGGILASCYTSTLAVAMHRLIVPMRSAPTLSSTTATNFALVGNAAGTTTSAISLTSAGTEFVRIDATGTGMIQGGACFIAANTGTSSPNIALSSEL
jgi:hypothetical protein